MSLEDIEKQLYGLKAPKTKSKPIHGSMAETPKIAKDVIQKDWSAIDAKEKIEIVHFPLWLKILFVFAGFTSLVTLGIVAFFLFDFSGQPENISIDIISPKEIYRGVPFELSVGVNNQGENILRAANLVLQLPNGVINTNDLNNQYLIQDSIGDVGSGSFTKRTYSLIGIGPKDSVQTIEANLSYAVGQNRFEEKNSYEIAIENLAVEIEIEKPEKVLNGSSLEIKVKYKNISYFDFAEVSLEAKYPTGFKFISASILPDALSNRWRLGELKNNASGELAIKGSVIGEDQASFNIPITAYANFFGKEYLLNESLASIAIAPSPVRLEIMVNNRDSYIAKIGDKLEYMMKYYNLSGIALSDVILQANISGELFDFSTISTNGALDSLTQTLSWNASHIPGLKLLDAGGSGEARFSVSLKNQFPIKRFNDKNFTLKAVAAINSPSVPYYLDAKETSTSASLETKVAGLVAFDAKALYRDPSSEIANSGRFPPKVNEPTEYTIHWLIKNYAVDLNNIQIKSSLSSGVSWTGVVKSNTDTVPLYNDRTQEIVWDIPKMPANQGILNSPFEAIFQIKAVPNQNQVGQFMPLVNVANLKAIDDFTGLELSDSDSGLNTALSDDPTVGKEDGRVLQ